jgi:hypothetical protein
MDPDVLRWVGWLRRRRGDRWVAVVEAPTIHQCARLLDAEARRRGVVSSANQVMTLGGGYPRPAGEPGGAETTPGPSGTLDAPDAV